MSLGWLCSTLIDIFCQGILFLVTCLGMGFKEMARFFGGCADFLSVLMMLLILSYFRKCSIFIFCVLKSLGFLYFERLVFLILRLSLTDRNHE